MIASLAFVKGVGFQRDGILLHVVNPIGGEVPSSVEDAENAHGVAMHLKKD